MKLSVDFTGIEDSLRNMGGQKAKIGKLRKAIKIDNPLEYQLLDQGEIILETQEDLNNVTHPAGLIAIGNTQVTLHIFDPFEDEESLRQIPAGKTRFHISDCDVLNKMRRRGRFDRYVAKKRGDDLFSVRPYDNLTKVRGEKMYSQLAPCRVCLKEINYEGYENSSKQVRDGIVAKFSTEEFFEHNHHIFRCLPLYTPETFPKGNYTSDWSRISSEYRSGKNWACECCGVDLHSNKGLLHAHHVDGNRGNNRFSNLKSLCVLCHKSQPLHESMHVRAVEKQKLLFLRAEQRISNSCRKCGG